MRREDAERFIEEIRGDEPELATYLWIEERELEVGGGPATPARAPAPKPPWGCVATDAYAAGRERPLRASEAAA